MRTWLIRERDRLQEEIGQAVLSASMADDDDHDESSIDGSHEGAVAVFVVQRIILQEVVHALGKFDDGSYGICEGCGNLIPLDRLEIRPQAALCLDCKTGDARSLRRALAR
ncbi:MAG: TraR/DksA C4-type zinc finger protein [Acetobacteraceae bacterium]|nr:TraR/DksA C4-type zinc finger protein [Acetobacteraceae bacterium]